MSNQTMHRTPINVYNPEDTEECPVVFKDGTFRLVECITDSTVIAGAAAECGCDIIMLKQATSPLFYCVDSTTPVNL
jgi:hypothetical protein